MFNLEAIGNPTFEAVTVDALKKHARIYISADDDYISSLLIAARMQVEKDLEMAVVGQEYHLYLEHWLDHFYIEHFFHWQFSANPYWFHPPRIALPIQPVQSVTSISYIDPAGDMQVLDESTYTLETWKDPVFIKYLDGGVLPGIKPLSEIVIDFTAGYATADDVPQLVKQAIMFLASHWYETREAVSSAMFVVSDAYERIVNRLRVKRLR